MPYPDEVLVLLPAMVQDTLVRQDSLVRGVIVSGMWGIVRHDAIGAIGAIWVTVAPALSLFLLGLAGYYLKRLRVGQQQIHILVNSQRTKLQRANAQLRAALTAAGIPHPPGTENEGLE